MGCKIKTNEQNILSKTAKTRFAILENRKKKQGKDDRKREKKHNGGGNLCVKPTKYQRIAFLEHKNFFFRKIICNFAAGLLERKRL